MDSKSCMSKCKTTHPGSLHKLKRVALVNGLDLCGLSTHQGFVSPDETERNRNIAHTQHCLDVAYDLGIPTIRDNTGRWGTTEKFDELMANGGQEPTQEGFTDDQGFSWVIDAYGQLATHAEKRGVVMGLENHWGLGRTAEGVHARCQCSEFTSAANHARYGQLSRTPIRAISGAGRQAVLGAGQNLLWRRQMVHVGD